MGRMAGKDKGKAMTLLEKKEEEYCDAIDMFENGIAGWEYVMPKMQDYISALYDENEHLKNMIKAYSKESE